MIARSAAMNYQKNSSKSNNPKPKKSQGKIWVKPHKRGSRTVGGFWRNLKGSIKNALNRAGSKISEARSDGTEYDAEAHYKRHGRSKPTSGEWEKSGQYKKQLEGYKKSASYHTKDEKGRHVKNTTFRNFKRHKKHLRGPQVVIKTSKGDRTIDEFHRDTGGTIEDYVNRKKKKKQSSYVMSRAKGAQNPKYKWKRRKSKNVILTGPQQPRR